MAKKNAVKTEQVVAVEVPKDANSFFIDEYSKLNFFDLYNSYIELPEGNYTILGKCEYFTYGFNYNGKMFEGVYDIGKLLESKGCQLTETNKYIILKAN